MPTKARARELRRHMTDAENRLWHHLRDRRLMGYRFRRQHPIGPFIADFACVACRLVVELDGGQHAEQGAAGAQRTAYVNRLGWRVVRFWNDDVLRNRGLVLEEILRQLASPSP